MKALPSTTVLTVPRHARIAGPGELARRGQQVAEQVVPDRPSCVPSGCRPLAVVVLRGGRELDHRVLDDAVVDAAAKAIRVDLDELLAGVDQMDVVDVRVLGLVVEDDRVEEEIPDGQVGDGDAVDAKPGPDPERHAAVVRLRHARARPAPRRRIGGRAANPDVGHAVDVERAGQNVGAWRDHDGGVRGQRP